MGNTMNPSEFDREFVRKFARLTGCKEENPDTDDMKLREWLIAARHRIDSTDADLIAIHVFHGPDEPYDRSWIALNADREIGGMLRLFADEMVRKREKGIPLAYIIGHKNFYGRDFMVDQSVLIPRPETELLIDLVRTIDLPTRPRFLEVGTGSGCVGITLALEFPQSRVLAVDISGDALMVAEANDNNLEGRIDLMQSDLLENVNMEKDGPFDVLVANLPYVNPEWDFIDRKALAAEPPLALYANGENGLSIYHRLLDQLDEMKFTGEIKYLVVETDPCQQTDMIKMAKEHGWAVHRKSDYGLLFRNTEL